MVLGMITGSVPMLFSLMLMQGITLSMWRSFLDRAIPTYKPGDLRKNIQTTLSSSSSSTEASSILPNLSNFENLNLQDASSIKQLENNYNNNNNNNNNNINDIGQEKSDNVLQSLHLLSKLDPKMLDLLNKMTTQNNGDIISKDHSIIKDDTNVNLLSKLQEQDPVNYAHLQQQLSSNQMAQTPEEVQYIQSDIQYEPNIQAENEANLKNNVAATGETQSSEQQYVLQDEQQQVQYVDPNYYRQTTSDVHGQIAQHNLDQGVIYKYVDESTAAGKESQVTNDGQMAQYQLAETVQSVAESESEKPPLIIGAPISALKAHRRHRRRHPQHRVKRRRKIRRRPRLSSLFRAKREIKNYKNIPKINIEMKKRIHKKSGKNDKIKIQKSQNIETENLKKKPTKKKSLSLKQDNKHATRIKTTKNKKKHYVKLNIKKKILQTGESNRIQVLVPPNSVSTKRMISLQSKKIQIDDQSSTLPTNCSFRRLSKFSHSGMNLLWNDKDGWIRLQKECSTQNASTVTITTAPTFRAPISPLISTKFYRGKIAQESEFVSFSPVTNMPTYRQIQRQENFNNSKNFTNFSIPPILTTTETTKFQNEFEKVLNTPHSSTISKQTSTLMSTLTSTTTTAPILSLSSITPLSTTTTSTKTPSSSSSTTTATTIITTTPLPSEIHINVTCSPTNKKQITEQTTLMKFPEHIVVNLINNLRNKDNVEKLSSFDQLTNTTTATTTTTTEVSTIIVSSTSVNPLTALLFKHLQQQQLKQQLHKQEEEQETITESIIKNKISELYEESKNTINQNEILNQVLTAINLKRFSNERSTIKDRIEVTTTKNEIFKNDILNHIFAAMNASKIDNFSINQMNKNHKSLLKKVIHTNRRNKIKSTPSEDEESYEEEYDDNNDDGDDESETETNDLSNESSSIDNKRFKRVCYYLLNGGKDGQLDVDLLEIHICSHLIVGYAKIHPNGLVVAERPLEDTEKYRRIALMKSYNPRLKVLLSIGDLGGATFSVVASNNRTRRIFADSVIDLCREFQFDGIDIDWEFPAIRTGFKPDRINLIYLLFELREREEKHWKNYNNDPLIISMAVGTPLMIASTSYIIPALAKLVDFVNLMSYDFHYFRPDRPFTGHHSPLYPRSSDKSYYSTLNVAWSATYWASRGMPLKKIIVGVPTYARTYNLVVPIGQGVLNAPASGVGLGGGKLNYTAVCDFLTMPNTIEQFDQHCQVPYAYRDYDWIAYENEMSVAIKTQWVIKTGMGGVVSFALNFDDSSGHCRRDSKKFPLQKTISNLLELASIKSYKKNSYIMGIRNK